MNRSLTSASSASGGEPHLHEGLPSRPSILVKLRDLAGAGDR